MRHGLTLWYETTIDFSRFITLESSAFKKPQLCMFCCQLWFRFSQGACTSTLFQEFSMLRMKMKVSCEAMEGYMLCWGVIRISLLTYKCASRMGKVERGPMFGKKYFKISVDNTYRDFNCESGLCLAVTA